MSFNLFLAFVYNLLIEFGSRFHDYCHKFSRLWERSRYSVIFFLSMNFLILYRFAQKVIGLKSLNFCFGNLIIDCLFRLPAILLMMQSFKYRDEFIVKKMPYRNNKNLYFTLLILSTIQILTYYYMWCFKMKKDKLNKFIIVLIIIFGKKKYCLITKLILNRLLFCSWARKSSWK